MLIRDLKEAQLTPGQKKEIKLNIGAMQDKIRELSIYKDNAAKINPGDYPESLQDDINDLIKLYQEEIEKLRQLVAAEADPQTRRLKRFFDFIKRDCSDALAQYNTAQDFLYRGVKAKKDEEDLQIYYGKPHENRKPVDSNVEIDKLFNDLLYQNGFNARRDNSIFVGPYNQASRYGTIYIIIPRNGYSFTYSTTHDDVILRNKTPFYDPTLIKYIGDQIVDLAVAGKFKDYELMGMELYVPNNPSIFEVNKIKERFAAEKKVMHMLPTCQLLKDQGQLTVPEGHPNLLDDKDNFISTDGVIKYYDLKSEKNATLADAVKSQNEVYLNSFYYAIRANSIDVVKESLGMTW